MPPRSGVEWSATLEDFDPSQRLTHRRSLLLPRCSGGPFEEAAVSDELDEPRRRAGASSRDFREPLMVPGWGTAVFAGFSLARPAFPLK